MKCLTCGKENDDDAQFCIHCGHNIGQSSSIPREKKRIGWGVWIGGALIIVVILAFLFGWMPSLSGPTHDCSVKAGYITIQNVPDSDAYVTLLDKDNNVDKALYLTAGSQGTIDGICNGRYYLNYEFGEQWDPSLNAFAVIKSNGNFVDPLDFDGSNYYDVSLVPGSGNARTSDTSLNTTADDAAQI
jgi:hypothetical protein